MRSPGAAFDLRAALTQELSAAIQEISAPFPQPASVHRCRVHLKRARALARVGKAGAPGLAAVFDDSARSVMKALAQTRDLTALAETARSAAKKAGKKRARALIAAAEALEAERTALPSVDVEAACAGIGDLQALAQVWPEASARQVRKGARRLAKRARKACERGRGASAQDARHQWRKREKDRFYAATLLDGAWPGKRRRREGDKLGDALGKERDALLLLKRIETTHALAATPKAAKRARKALKQRAQRMGARADKLAAQVHAGGA